MNRSIIVIIMRRVLLSLITLTVMTVTAFSQPYREYTDSVINHLFEKRSWGELLDQSHSLLKRGYDSNNLRIKAGVAAYELKKYREAVTHLQKSWEVNPGDSLVNYYYYRALVGSGRDDEASLLASKMNPGMREAMVARVKGIVNEIAVEGSLARNRDFDALTEEVLPGEGGIKSYRIVEKSRENYGISLGHHLFPHINLNHEFSMLQIDRVLRSNSWVIPPPSAGNPTTKQYQYFLNARYNLLKGWGFNISGTYIWGEGYEYLPFSYDMMTEKYTLGQTDLEIRDNVVSLGVSKESAWLSTSLSAGFGTINGFRQYQGNLSLTFFPLGNNNFFIKPDVTLHHDEEPGEYKVVFQPQIGFKTDPFWVTGEYGTGKMKNFFSEGGKVVYNVPETVTGYWGVVLTAPMLKNKLHLSARYRQSSREAPHFVIENNLVSGEKNFSFTDQLVMFSVEWDF